MVKRVLAVTLAAAVVVVAWLVARTLLGFGAREVLLVYVREENSGGLADLPLPENEARSGLDASSGVVRLPPGMRRLPLGTRLLVLRETFAAGLLVESRAVCLRRLPGGVPGRAAGTGGAPSGGQALLGVDLVVGPGVGVDRAFGSVRVTVEGLAGAGGDGGGAAWAAIDLEPGREWRLGAVVAGGVTVVREADDPGYAAWLREAFAAGSAVSVLSVTAFGYWPTDRIEPGSEGGG